MEEEEDWSRLGYTLTQKLKNASMLERTTLLSTLKERISSSRYDEEQLQAINSTLFSTYTHHNHRKVRLHIHECLQALWADNKSIFGEFVKLLKVEAAKGSLSPGPVLVLIEFASIAIQYCATRKGAWDAYGSDLITADAQLLEREAELGPRKTVVRAADTVTWRALRKLFRHGQTGLDALTKAVTLLAAQSSRGNKNAILLGLIAGVCARLISRGNSKDENNLETPYAAFKSLAKQYYEFWAREVISSKRYVDKHITVAFQEYWSNFATVEGLTQYLVPSLEKSLLRSPEVVLNGVIQPIITSLPETIDLSDILANHLLKPLTGNLKSSDRMVREIVVEVFGMLLVRSRDEKCLDTVLTEILKPLAASKLSSADLRTLHSQILTKVHPSVKRSTDIANGIATIVSKEPNEGAMSAESIALTHHLSYLSLQDKDNTAAAPTAALVKGLTEKKTPVLKQWILRAGTLLWSFRCQEISTLQPTVAPVCEEVVLKLLDIFAEVTANPLPAAQSGQIIAGYIVVAMYDFLFSLDSTKLKTALEKAKVWDATLSTAPKPSFLLNHKAYSKVTSDDDASWLTRALAACTSQLQLQGDSLPADTEHAWSKAFIFLHVSSTVSYQAHQGARDALRQEYLKFPAFVSSAIIRGLWEWWHDQDLHVKGSPADMSQPEDYRSLYTVVRSICVSKDEQTKIPQKILSDQAINLLVLVGSELIHRMKWIDTCLDMGLDPGAVISEHPQRALDKINSLLSNTDSSEHSKDVRRAGYASFADLAFVAPEAILPLLTNQIRHDLSLEELKSFGPTDYAIARTNPEMTFVDVLSASKVPEVPHKSDSNYEILAWEAEVRKEQQKKASHETKLTAEEKAKVQAQLAKEADIRERVHALERRLHRGAGTIRALAHLPSIDPEQWIGYVLKPMIDMLQLEGGQLLGDYANEAFLSCSELVSQRLGSLRLFIGVATLRAYGANEIHSELKEESLASLVTRVLYRLRLSGEQRPFDAVSFCYMLPLVHLVLNTGGISSENRDTADEQVTLAVEILGLHSDVCASAALPRAEIISVVISAMQTYNQHYRNLKDTLIDVCRSVTNNITPMEVQSLLLGAVVPESSVRTAVLQGIREHIDLTDLDFCEEIWLAVHDDAEENIELGQAIWKENALEAEGKDVFKLLPYLQSKHKPIRRAAARSIAAIVALDGVVFNELFDKLQEEYREKAKTRLPERDAYGMLKKMDLSDPWEARDGVGLAIGELAEIWPVNKLMPGINFLIQDKALGDQSPATRDTMIESATKLISAQGGKKLEELMTMFEEALADAEASTSGADLVNEAVVILYGALAKHLKAGDQRVSMVVVKLLDTLSTPSETVQFAVSGCLPPLVRLSMGKVSEYVQRELDALLQSKKYAARRGAAYGLAGIISGRGLGALREFRIMSTIKGAADNKKDVNARQGALFAFELLALILGRTFEPYVIQIVDILISSFGDASADVREACLDTSKTCFSILSSYGVKEILPKLLDGLDESQWRSKKGACDLLGSMAYLDPQQLASSLPEIIPPLTNVLNDSHKEVRNAANRSLQRFGEVISNPEVKSLVNILLKALSDPTKYTDSALDALIKVSFTHYLDAPSLALVVRILERGLGDRSGTKRKAAQIIGSLAHLTERKDLISHLPILVAGLRIAAIDPVPTTRATASKALGSLVEKLGEDALPDLIPSLMATLKSDTGAGDRLGSAQALSEVLAGLGTGRLEETLPTILQNVSSSRPAVREGFMSLFIFLPACFGNSFANYLNRIIPPILAGLADEVESIRETSLRAGRLLVKNFATKSIDLLLPELDRGLGDDNYRIRLSSVELVGDLLFNLTGISGLVEEDEDSNAAEAGASLLEVLGEEKRNKILSSLYICRCDTSGLVRTAAVTVWKALVATPKTLKELIPTLTQAIIKRLASSNPEQKVIAGNALGELIRKAGDGVLATLLPTLEEGLQSTTDVDNKQGICIALREIISSSSSESLEDYEKTLISVVRVALVDSDAEVRETAAEAFDSLQDIFGKKAVDQVMPHLLSLLRDEEEAATALSALLTLLTDNTRANIILPNLIPTLLKRPITIFNARAIASLAEVAGGAMSRRLSTILNTLMAEIIFVKDPELRSELESSFDSILLSVDEYDGLNNTMSVLFALVKDNDHKIRSSAASRFGHFISQADVDFSRYYPDIIRVLLMSFEDSDLDVVKASCAALTELMKRLKKEEMESLVGSTRQLIQHVGVAGHDLPGFSLPKGIDAILPIFLQGLVNGPAEQRTLAALAISDIIDRTSVDGLKPFVTKITGPLIRVVSERSVELKAAILLTLNNLLEKMPAFLKPFLPQLQRTFAKSLADTSSEILRSRAAKALGTLLTLKPRVDPLIAELVTGTKTSDAGVRNAMLKALYEVVSKAGENMSEASRNAILGLIDTETEDINESTTITNAKLLGALIKSLPAADAHPLIKSRALATKMTRASVLNLNSILVESPTALLTAFAQETPALISQGIGSGSTFFSDNSILAAGKYLLQPSDAEGAPTFDSSKLIFQALASVIPPGHPADTRRLALVVLRTVSRHNPQLVRPHLPLLAPPIFASVRDMVIPVKLSAEGAFLALFDVVEHNSAIFDKYISGSGSEGLAAAQKKSMSDYFKRVALRLGGQARERLEAEGGTKGSLGLSSDEAEDEREVWSVGKVEIGDVFSD